MDKNKIVPPIIWSIAIIITAFLLGRAIKNRNTANDMISVVGLGTKDFISDEIMWSGSYSARSMDPKEAYAKIVNDKEKVKQFFLTKGFTEKEISLGGITLNKLFRTVETRMENSYERKSEEVFDGYEAKQNVTFTAKKNPTLMDKIEKVSEQTSELINSGIEFVPNTIQYSYSDLASLKHSLIESATKDASDRAKKIVKSGDGNLGKLKSASMGVFQITGKGSNEEDSYGGNFDIYSKEKTARITVRLSYNLN